MFKPTLLMPRTSLPCHVQIYLYMFKLTLPRSNWLCHVQTYPATFKLTLPRSKLLCHVQTYPGTFKLVLVGFWLVKLSLLGFISVTKNVEKDVGVCASPWQVSGKHIHRVRLGWNFTPKFSMNTSTWVFFTACRLKNNNFSLHKKKNQSHKNLYFLNQSVILTA